MTRHKSVIILVYYLGVLPKLIKTARNRQ
ncbi:MAG: hypothetical protein RJB15_1699, partial [Pseudomonadota bacterium]